MGMPLTNFNVMRVLARGGAEYEREVVAAALAPFELFAFVLHDRNEHVDVEAVLAGSFDVLDHATGTKLLFFAVCDAPEGWREYVQTRPYVDRLQNWQSIDLLKAQAEESTGSPGIGALAVAESFGIDPNDLPCIVVTRDLGSREFLWVKTCGDHLTSQLLKIGTVAERLRGEAYAHLETSLPEIDKCGGFGAQSLTESLAALLADVLACASVGVSGEGRPDTRASRLALEVVGRALKQVAAARRGHLEEPFERLSIQLARLLALSNPQPDALTSLEPYLVHFEAASQTFVRTALKARTLLGDWLANNRGPRLGPVFPAEGFDFSASVVCLSKAFENEINISVIQWARERYGIELPAFFGRHQPGVRAVVLPDIPGPMPIDLNRSGRGAGIWEPPAVGQALLACQKVAKEFGIPKFFDDARWRTLELVWRSIRDRRNAAAHVTVLGQAEAVAVEHDLLKLGEGRVLESMMSLKASGRGG